MQLAAQPLVRLGKPIQPRTISPNGTSPLPASAICASSGYAAPTLKIFSDKCALCHGGKGAGRHRRAVKSVVCAETSLNGSKTIANYWPYATTVFDYIRRAMPFPSRSRSIRRSIRSLLYSCQNKLIGEDDEINMTLPKVPCRTATNFIVQFPDQDVEAPGYRHGR